MTFTKWKGFRSWLLCDKLFSQLAFKVVLELFCLMSGYQFYRNNKVITLKKKARP